MFDGVPVVIYKPENYSPGGVSMMYFHGGGFVLSTPGTLSLYFIMHYMYILNFEFRVFVTYSATFCLSRHWPVVSVEETRVPV